MQRYGRFWPFLVAAVLYVGAVAVKEHDSQSRLVDGTYYLSYRIAQWQLILADALVLAGIAALCVGVRRWPRR